MADRKDLKGKLIPAKHFKNLATDNEDAETADVFMQLAVMGDRLDVIEVPGFVVLTSKHQKKVPAPILDAVQHIICLEDYTPEQLELIILQRLKYANIDYENEYVLQDIVRYGKNNLRLSIRFLKCCVAVMQSEGRQKLNVEDVIKSARLNRLNDLNFEDTIPF